MHTVVSSSGERKNINFQSTGQRVRELHLHGTSTYNYLVASAVFAAATARDSRLLEHAQKYLLCPFSLITCDRDKNL